MFERGFHRQGGDIGFAQIPGGRLRLDALRRELLHPLSQADRVSVGCHQPRTRFAEGLGYRMADLSGTTHPGDQNDLAVVTPTHAHACSGEM